jgi:hypothetical protein
MLPSLLEHELRLTQKVPVSSNPVLTPKFANTVRRTRYRVKAGCRVLWYEYDPFALAVACVDNPCPVTPAPVAYRFEPDLSATPDVKVIELDLAEKFVISAVQARADENCWTAGWEKLWEKIPPPDFSQTLEKLVESGLLYIAADATKHIRPEND